MCLRYVRTYRLYAHPFVKRIRKVKRNIILTTKTSKKTLFQFLLTITDYNIIGNPIAEQPHTREGGEAPPPLPPPLTHTAFPYGPL